MRPMIKPSLRCLRRDDTTVQIGLEGPRALVLTGDGASHVVGCLDGTRDRAQVVATALSNGVPPETTHRVLDLLADHGVLDDAATDTSPLREMSRAERDRLTPDLAVASLVSGEADAGLSILVRRRTLTVHIHGAGRVGSAIATLLAATGVGHVRPIDPHPVRHADIAPAGLRSVDPGVPRDHAVAATLRQLAPSTRDDDLAPPDLAVLAPVDGLDPSLPDALFRDGTPHLLVASGEASGTVGPLVLPGRTSCLRCQHLHRADRDPAWPRLAAQLARSPRRTSDCDAVLGTTVSALAAAQALSYLDAPAAWLPTLDGSLDLTLPEWQWRRRSWPPHPRCGCGWGDTGIGRDDRQ